MASKQLVRNPILHVLSPLTKRITERFFPGTSPRTLTDGLTPSESSKTGRTFVRRWNGVFKRRSRGRVTLHMLPEDVLIDIFDFYRMDFPYYPWRWHTLAHVCRSWRCLIFASPRRLDLQFLCTPRTPVRELLDYLPPAMPIMISNWSSIPPPYDPLNLENGGQVLSAIEERDRVRWLHLDGVTGALLEKLVAKMQETFSEMTFVRLWSDDSDDKTVTARVPVLPEAFLGGSSPHLQTLWLHGVSFPHLPKLLLSTSDLIVLRLENIPDSGYISCEDMVTSLATSTKLETLTIEFQSMLPQPDGTAQPPVTSLTRVALPALTLFKFKGNGGYFDNFVVRFESHLLVPDFDQGWHEHNANRKLVYEASYSPESGLRLHSESWIPR